MVDALSKYPDEKFLLPCSDVLKPTIPKLLNESGVNWNKAIFYKTVISDLSDLRNVYYDILVFFSPSGIESLVHNFPDFQQIIPESLYLVSQRKSSKKQCLKS